MRSSLNNIWELGQLVRLRSARREYPYSGEPGERELLVTEITRVPVPVLYGGGEWVRVRVHSLVGSGVWEVPQEWLEAVVPTAAALGGSDKPQHLGTVLP
jgi:hypothetical protein